MIPVVTRKPDNSSDFTKLFKEVSDTEPLFIPKEDQVDISGKTTTPH